MLPGPAFPGIIYHAQVLGVVIPTSQMRKGGTKNGSDQSVPQSLASHHYVT